MRKLWSAATYAALVLMVAGGLGGSACSGDGASTGGDVATGGDADVVAVTDTGATDQSQAPDGDDVPSVDDGTTTDDTGATDPSWQVDNLGAGDRDLVAVWCADGDDCIAVGPGGMILRKRGDGWVPMESGTRADLYGVFGLGDGTAFAVGAEGTVLVLEDGRWSDRCGDACQAELPVDDDDDPADLHAVWAESLDRYFVAGDLGVVLRFENGGWYREQTGLSSGLLTMWGNAATDLYVGGTQGQMLHRNGSTWTARQVFDSTASVTALWGQGTTELWAVGSGGRTIRRGTGDGWEAKETNDIYDRDLYAVWGDGPNRVWAAGDDGVLLRWDGERWGLEEIDGPNYKGADFRAMSGGEGSDGELHVYVLGAVGAAIGRNADRTWTDRRTDPAQSLLDLWGPADGRPAVAVGEDGVILEATDGGPAPLALVDSGVELTLHGVHGADEDDVWAVGDAGTVLRREAEGWTVVPAGAAMEARLNDVWVGDDGQVLVVGETGTALLWDGDAWAREQSGTLANLVGLWARGSVDDAWAVAEDGSVLHRDTQGWAIVAQPAAAALRAVWGDEEQIWVSGDNGFVAVGDGDGFTVVNEAPGSFFYALSGSALAADWGPVVLAAGWAGRVLVRGPDGWSEAETGTFQELRAVHVWPQGAVAVGRAGVYLYRTEGWTSGGSDQ